MGSRIQVHAGVAPRRRSVGCQPHRDAVRDRIGAARHRERAWSPWPMTDPPCTLQTPRHRLDLGAHPGRVRRACRSSCRRCATSIKPTLPSGCAMPARTAAPGTTRMSWRSTRKPRSIGVRIARLEELLRSAPVVDREFDGCASLGCAVRVADDDGRVAEYVLVGRRSDTSSAQRGVGGVTGRSGPARRAYRPDRSGRTPRRTRPPVAHPRGHAAQSRPGARLRSNLTPRQREARPPPSRAPIMRGLSHAHAGVVAAAVLAGVRDQRGGDAAGVRGAGARAGDGVSPDRGRGARGAGDRAGGAAGPESAAAALGVPPARCAGGGDAPARSARPRRAGAG